MKPLVVSVFALGICLLPAQAQDASAPRPRKEDRQPRMQEHLERALHLTDAQKTTVGEIRGKHKAALETKRAAAQSAHKAFSEAMRNPDAKPEDLKTLHRAQADASLDLLLEHRAQRQEIRAILTPEQREKAARIEGRMEGRMMGHGGGFPGGGMR